MAVDFIFNDELFLTKEDQVELEKRFPKVGFAFYTCELIKRFVPINKEALREKRNFRAFGLSTVGLATLALVLAAIEPVFLGPAAHDGKISESIVTYTAIMASIAGLLSVLIGWAGMGITSRKRAWMRLRLKAERLRQWQWQYLIAHIPEIMAASGSEEGRKAYKDARALRFESFWKGFNNQIGARLNEQLDELSDADTKSWLEPSFANMTNSVQRIQELETAASDEEAAIVEELFAAYGGIRFKSQDDYTTYLLGDGAFWTHPKRQKELLEDRGHLMVAAIVVLHIGVVAGTFMHINELKSPFVFVMTISCALFALALRVIEQGLRPAEQIVRLRGYLSAVSSARARFSSDNLGRKLEAMRKLEEAAAREMTDFLQTADTTRYVM